MTISSASPFFVFVFLLLYLLTFVRVLVTNTCAVIARAPGGRPGKSDDRELRTRLDAGVQSWACLRGLVRPKAEGRRGLLRDDANSGKQSSLLSWWLDIASFFPKVLSAVDVLSYSPYA